ncbi:MAG: hypothetical protein J7498_15670 [Sphingobium sp.]|nr:hypothetical protein [Sphingobium sp.]
MKIALALIAAIATLPFGPAAQARVGDAKWAACVWSTDSQAASNWLGMKAPAWQDAFGSLSELLGLRLIALCDATPADPKKPNRLPNWKAMQQALKGSQPKGALPTAPASPIKARICEYHAVKGEERAPYLAETVRVDDQITTVVHQVYFDQAGTGAVNVVDYAGRKVSFQLGMSPERGAAVRMPQATLIASPADGYASEKQCRVISIEGTLVDA